jgi:hypothetical protein
MSDEKRFTYVPTTKKLFPLFAICLLGGMLVFERGFEGQAIGTMILGGAAISMAAFMAIAFLHRARSQDKYLILNDDSIYIPGNLFQKGKWIPYESVRSIRQFEVGKKKCIELHSSLGLHLLAQNQLKEEGSFESIENVILESTGLKLGAT